MHRCDCTLKIDGVVQGTFRLNPYCGYSIERPVAPGTRTGRFTFVTEEAIGRMTEKERRTAGVEFGKEENGLVEARFVPEAAAVAALQRLQNVASNPARAQRRRNNRRNR